MIILINFTDKGYIYAKELQKHTALTIGCIDKVIEYSPDNLDDEFKKKIKRYYLYQKVLGIGYGNPI